MSTNIPPVDINSVLQAQIAGEQRGKKVNKEDNDRERSRQEQIRAEMEHSSQVEDPNAIEQSRALRDEQRRQGRRGPRHHEQEPGENGAQRRPPDEYIPSKEAREQGLAGPDPQPPAEDATPPPPPAGPDHLIDLEA
jgi:hypothetical protein